MNTGLRMASAMNPYLPFRTGVYPTPADGNWLAAAVLLFAQLADSPLAEVIRRGKRHLHIAIRIGI